MVTGLFLSGCESNEEKDTIELTEHQKAWIADIDGEMREKLDLSAGITENMTKEERRLWYDFLRKYPVRFIRQKIIGNYIVDFYCAKANVIIELDGSQHYEPQGIAYG